MGKEREGKGKSRGGPPNILPARRPCSRHVTPRIKNEYDKINNQLKLFCSCDREQYMNEAKKVNRKGKSRKLMFYETT